MNVRQLAARVPLPVPSQQPGGLPPPTQAPADRAATFAEALAEARSARESGSVRVSAHAATRMRQRGIQLGPGAQSALSDAMNALDAKGAESALMLRRGAAFVVNVPSRTVITAMSGQELDQRVFTNIDSAFLFPE